MTKTRECPHPQCSTMLDRSRFACPPHWGGLPQSIKTGINSAFTEWRSDPLDEGLLAALEESQERALAHWGVK